MYAIFAASAIWIYFSALVMLFGAELSLIINKNSFLKIILNHIINTYFNELEFVFYNCRIFSINISKHLLCCYNQLQKFVLSN